LLGVTEVHKKIGKES